MTLTSVPNTKRLYIAVTTLIDRSETIHQLSHGIDGTFPQSLECEQTQVCRKDENNNNTQFQADLLQMTEYRCDSLFKDLARVLQLSRQSAVRPSQTVTNSEELQVIFAISLSEHIGKSLFSRFMCFTEQVCQSGNGS